MNNKLIIGILVIIIALAGFLRFWRVDLNVEYPYNPDEVFFISPVFNIMDLKQPSWYGAPGTTLVYANTFIFYGVSLFINEPGSVEEKYNSDPIYFNLAARLFYELIGLITVLLTYFLAIGIFKNKLIGLLSAAALGLSVLHVEHSHYIRPDILATFFLLLVSYYGWYIYKRGKLKYYAGAGIFLALAVATKYPAAIGVVFIITAHLLRYYKNSEERLLNKKIFYFGLLALLVFTIVFPFYITDWSTLVENIKWESRSEHGQATSMGFLDNLLFYIKGNFWYTGTLIFLFSLFGMKESLMKNWKIFVYLFSFILIFLIFISSLALHWDRWFIMLLPFMSIFSSLGIYYFFSFLKGKLNNKALIFYLLCFIILLVIFYPAWLRSIRQSYALGHKDTRDISKEWIIHNLESSKSAVLEDNGPDVKNYFNNVVLLSTSSIKFPDYWKNEKNMDYQIVNSWIYERVIYNPDPFPYYRNSYITLFNKYKLLNTFEYSNDKNRDYVIKINDLDLFTSHNIFNYQSFNGPKILIFEL